MANKTESQELRVRLKPEFGKEIDQYLKAINRGRVANQMDKSRLVREAVMNFIANNPIKSA